MITRPVLICLRTFNKAPSAKNVSFLVGIPSLLEVLKLTGAPYDQNVLGVCQWLEHWASNVLDRLLNGDNMVPADTIPELAEEDFRKVSI